MLLIFITQLAAVFAQSSDQGSERLLTSWKVAIVGGVSDDFEALDVQRRKVSLSIVPLLQTLIKEVPERQLSSEELYLAREHLREKTLEELSEQLIAKQERLDIKNIQETKSLDIWNSRRLETKDIDEIKQRIKKVRDISNEDIPVENVLPIELLERNDVFHIDASTDLSRLANELGAQELFYYTIELLNRYVVISLYKYIELLEDSEQILRTIARPTDVQQLFNSLSQVVRTAVFGSPTASLRVKVKSAGDSLLKDARILMDGELVGFGEVYLSTIQAGTHSLTVFYEDEQRNQVIAVDEFENASRTFLFTTGSEDTITVLTYPGNAKVYINSEWVGNSPVTVARTILTQQLEIIVPGYIGKRRTLNHLTPSVLRLTLDPINKIPLDVRLKEARNDFYLTFSMMGLSLLPPLFLYGFYINEAQALREGGGGLSETGYQESLQRRDAYFYSALGGTALTIGAIIWFSFEFADYLKVASEYHER